MGGSITRKRPWLAALLATIATGLGHLYLRRWRRAVGWLALLFGVSALFVEPAALDALASLDGVDFVAIAPVLVVGCLSVVDAYVLAHAHNAVARTTVTPDGRLTHCPNCGRELDADLEFCHWCTAAVGDLETAPLDRVDERNGD